MLKRLFALLIFASFGACAGTFPFIVNPTGFVPSPTPNPHPTVPANNFICGFNGQAAGPTPTPIAPATAVPQNVAQELNTEALETQAGRTFACQVQYADPYYFTNTTSTNWCNTVGCVTATDPRIVGDLARHRMPFFSWTVTLPATVDESMASYLPASVGQTLGFPVNYSYEKFDKFIDTMAQKLKSYPGVVDVRPFHEFNLCVNEFKSANSGLCSNGDSKFAFPVQWPPSCPSWPSKVGCSNTTVAQEGILFQAWWEYIVYRVSVLDHATNIVFTWNPSYGGSANPLSLAQEKLFLPTTCYMPSCTTPVAGVYDVDYLALDSYDYGGLLTYSGTVGAWYTSFNTYGLPMALVETGAPNNTVTTASNGTTCSTTYTPGPETQAIYGAEVLSSLPTISWKLYSWFQSWSAYPSCNKNWNFDQFGKNAYFTDAGNVNFDAMPAGTPAPHSTPWPTPTP